MNIAGVICKARRNNRLLSLALVVLMLVVLPGCGQQTQKDSNTGDGTAVALAQEDKSVTGKRIYFAAPLFSESERDYLCEGQRGNFEVGYTVLYAGWQSAG